MGRTGVRARRPDRTVGHRTLAVAAREAGVSVPTASKVLDGRKDAAPDTRRRVTEALRGRSAGRGPGDPAAQVGAEVRVVVDLGGVAE
ncbi:hypothetical protein LRR80_01417 [Streptomyces sp. RO-S4]|nr:hypothetical protein [Streptomyces sp. RO-S4]